jgi:hypothetical protein
MTPLTEEQMIEVRTEMVPSKDTAPVRFMEDGCACNVVTGEKCSRGCNVIYQMVYWNFARGTAKKIASWTGTKPIFEDTGGER